MKTLSLMSRYSYSQPSQSETFGGDYNDSEYDEIEALIQQDQYEIEQQQPLIQQDQSDTFVYPPQTEVEFGFQQTCYCGNQPKIATR
ncbi:hypothetical protein Bca52824_009936 [Brassica carinata]|uniref:Uncharacterized protein n=1 Tax=Brassica carinata TaxID=52824 RepID=A0A8X7WF16_BRACI|nr:hypothetical protein Bca52824_009936 [Brassica carinata]